MADIQSLIGDNRIGLIRRLQANRNAGTWKTVRFNPPFCKGSRVIVLAQTQTRRGPDTPGLRIRKVTARGFQIRYDEVFYTRDLAGVVGPYGSQGAHPKFENVGWAAYALTRCHVPGEGEEG